MCDQLRVVKNFYNSRLDELMCTKKYGDKLKQEFILKDKFLPRLNYCMERVLLIDYM